MPLARLNKTDAFALLDQAFALGVTAIDTAHVYGAAETQLGAWLQARQVPRAAVFLIGKAGHPSRGRARVREARKDARESLARLGVESFDLLLLHRDDPEVP